MPITKLKKKSLTSSFLKLYVPLSPTYQKLNNENNQDQAPATQLAEKYIVETKIWFQRPNLRERKSIKVVYPIEE